MEAGYENLTDFCLDLDAARRGGLRHFTSEFRRRGAANRYCDGRTG
jgi:hypothetical protein